MNALELFFNLFVGLAFCASVVDHYFLGRGRVLVPLRVFILGCFIFTEGYLAATAQPIMMLYLLLNLWGLLHLYLGRKSPLRVKNSNGP